MFLLFDFSVLTSRLESDASEVQGAAVGQMPAMSQALVQAIFGLGIGFYYSWRVSLVLLACAPVLFLSSIAQMKMITGFSKQVRFLIRANVRRVSQHVFLGKLKRDFLA